MYEFELINNYFSKIAKRNKSALNLNDDVFFDKQKGIVISVDTYNLGTHFKDFKSPDLVMKKILRSSISDLICKGVSPKFYFISGAGDKKTFNKNNLSKISKSLQKEQNKFKLFLGGGDTTFSKKLSFTITTLGYSKKIIFRNKAKLNDDIYVTGNLGDSFMGLQILKNKIKTNSHLAKYFIDKYYKPDLKFKLLNYLFRFANTSIDISDGLVDDMAKMINKQNLSFILIENKIPISDKFNRLIKSKRLKKINYVSKGDDYQILFTANRNKSRIIKTISSITKTKITRIGRIISGKNRSLIINEKGNEIKAKYNGYIHRF